MNCQLKNILPQIAPSAFIAAGVQIIGRVRLGKKVSVWYNSVLRADIAEIVIGDYSNIQDGTVVHVDYQKPTIVGKYVTVGHNVTLHACTVGDGALIGMGSIILNGATIGQEAIVAAGAVVPPGTKIPPRTLWMGVPAKFIKKLSAVESGKGRRLAKEYAEKIIKLYD
ncbi:gamma carbonic anhydrase family protein [Candidatus Saganbacteria bacterium]|nr:gamma carbonic anhydrase family protein [Candidatus Saganbacteria bacterium]